MSITKLLQAGCVAVAATFSVVALGSAASSSVWNNSAAFSVSQDFLTVSKFSASDSDKAKAEAEADTLVDWQFTGRERPAKCRFGN